MYRIAKAYFVGRLFLLPQLQPAKYISWVMANEKDAGVL